MTPRCKCGCRIVEVDGHYICEGYFRDIQNGLEETERMIKENEEY